MKFLEYHGWIEALRRARIFVLGPVFLERSGFIGVLRPESVAAPNRTLRVRELNLTDGDRMLKVMYVSRLRLEERFGAGDRCFAVLDDANDIVAYIWVKCNTFHVAELDLSFKCELYQAWLYNAVTVRHARGRGYYTQLYRFLVDALKRQGIDEFYACAEDIKAASLAGMKKANFDLVAKVKMRKLLGIRKYEVTVFEEELWCRLRDRTMDLPAPRHVKVQVASESGSSGEW